MPRIDHIRVGFVDADCRDWPVDTKWGKGAQELTDYLWRANVNGRLDLVLGVIRNGASYLLLPRAWADAWDKRVGRPAFFVKTRRPTDYASLSPIHFIEHQDLFKKLKEYEQTSNKKKNRIVSDRSRANQTYFMSRAPGEADLGLIRATFENSRLLYVLLYSTDRDLPQLPAFFRQPLADFPRLSSEAYAVHRDSAYARARVLALSFSTITAGTEQDTRVLDIGWCDVSVQSATTNDAMNCLFGDQKMKVPTLRFTHDSVTSELLPPDVISGRLQQIFRLASPRNPIILLVHSAENTRKQLDRLGIRTSSWVEGFHSVLYEGGLRGCERSRSPPRHGYGRPRSPPRSLSAVHIIDVEALNACATNTTAMASSTDHVRVRRILENAAPLNLDIRGREIEQLADPEDPKSPMVKKNTYNAGHDSILIAETWLVLASGADIDGQRDMIGEDRIHGLTATAEHSHSSSPQPGTQRERNDDDDPNILPPASDSGRAAGGASAALDPYRDLSDEEGEWIY